MYAAYFQLLEDFVAPVRRAAAAAHHAAAAVARTHSSLSGRLGHRGQLPRHTPRLDRHGRLCHSRASLVFAAFRGCAHARGAEDGDRAHMHNFNDFMIKQRARWDVV